MTIFNGLEFQYNELEHSAKISSTSCKIAIYIPKNMNFYQTLCLVGSKTIQRQPQLISD